ncbi:MAG TPA: ABC transporter ATP-binding protein [Candidatus Bathyarchaeia archaeon]|nr:ABC transporter ATP-binding protein [Candidatus Bathyarchaeia archaeon]
MDNQNIVVLRKVRIVLGGKKIIRTINWTIKKGQHWVLIGPNGSGKTTLLRLINGYLWPTSGTVNVLGKRFGKYDLRELRKSIGFASSIMTEKIPEELSVLETVLSGKFGSIGLHDRPTSKERKQAISLLRKVGCFRFAKKPYGTLSQGEKQRVIIARALMSSPKLLALDESCDGLDLDARENFLSFLDSVGRLRRGPSMIFTTHRVEEIPSSFTHALIIREGRAVASGPKRITLTSKNLSKAFMRNVSIVRRKGRYSTIVS